MRALRDVVRRGLRRAGLDVVRTSPQSLTFPSDYDPATCETIRAVAPYTMTSSEKLFALCSATRYVHRHGIPGAIVECGVFRGGSMMAVARTLSQLGDETRELYLFDTYEGMVEPGDVDRHVDGRTASEMLGNDMSQVARAGLDEVRLAMSSTGYPEDRMRFVKGRVEETIPAAAPGRIAILRLDTDWYESTRHELDHLYPRISSGGVLIVDDYGAWQGSKKAVDQFLQATGARVLLLRIDEGRIAVIP